MSDKNSGIWKRIVLFFAVAIIASYSSLTLVDQEAFRAAKNRVASFSVRSSTPEDESKIDQMIREASPLEMVCSDIPKVPSRPDYQVSCWIEPFTVGRWIAYEYVDGTPEFRTSPPTLTDSITIFLNSDPGPFILIEFYPADGGEPLSLDVGINAGHLKRGSQSLPGRGSKA